MDWGVGMGDEARPKAVDGSIALLDTLASRESSEWHIFEL